MRKYEESESWSEILGNDCDDTFQAFWMIDVDPAGARDPHDFKDGHIAAQMVVNHAVTVNTTVLELGTLSGDQSSVDFLDRTGGVPMRNIFKRVTKEAPLAMSVDLINAPLLKRIMSGDSVPLVGSPSWVCVCTFVCDNATKKLLDPQVYVPSWDQGFRCTTTARFIVFVREKDPGQDKEKCKLLTLVPVMGQSTKEEYCQSVISGSDLKRVHAVGHRLE